ncbi:MAG: methyl-accepting chemotaxis protein, partial [Bordetella sp.]
VKRVTDIMGEISAASEEQSSGIDQVNLAVTQMDETTQQNAALVEQAAAAAGSLEEQARNLAEAVSVFKIQSGEVIDMQAKQLASSRPSAVHAAPRAATRASATSAPPVAIVDVSSKGADRRLDARSRPAADKLQDQPRTSRKAAAADADDWESF